MLDDRWPDEPDDPGKPEELDPVEDIGPEVPQVEVPRAPDPSKNEVPDDVARSFWKLVAIFNLALFALALGPMLVVFRGELVNGGAVFLLGAGAFFYGYQRYRSAKADLADAKRGEAGEGTDTDDAADDHNG